MFTFHYLHEGVVIMKKLLLVVKSHAFPKIFLGGWLLSIDFPTALGTTRELWFWRGRSKGLLW